jgi:hypothetical protein
LSDPKEEDESLKLAELQTDGGLNVILQARDGSRNSSSRHAESAAAFANNRWSTATTTTNKDHQIVQQSREREREREREKRLGKKLVSEEELCGFFLGVLVAPGLVLEVVE